jgi:hypothetical protein
MQKIYCKNVEFRNDIGVSLVLIIYVENQLTANICTKMSKRFQNNETLQLSMPLKRNQKDGSSESMVISVWSDDRHTFRKVLQPYRNFHRQK